MTLSFEVNNQKQDGTERDKCYKPNENRCDGRRRTRLSVRREPNLSCCAGGSYERTLARRLTTYLL